MPLESNGILPIPLFANAYTTKGYFGHLLSF